MQLTTTFIEDEIVDQFLYDENPRPWVIGFSGGKDSTMLLQLVWYALKKIPEPLRNHRPIYVVCNNTLVENPKILKYVSGVLRHIQEAATKQGLPIFVHKTVPRLEDTFWLNLIGKGYPAPNNVFRWCTERLKINPTTRFIQEKIKETGEVIILLGTRSAESVNRAKSFKKYEIKGKRLKKHVLAGAYYYTPIKDFTTDEVWQYLMQKPSPWGGSNRELITLYRNASGGDCPLILDATTPSCGNSRFGCWVCTVVKRDKSMEGLISNGEEWMMPLMELRDLLAISRDSEEYREKRRRNGTEKEGTLGPYKPYFRAKILELLLSAQKEINLLEPDQELITQQELVAIQIIWYRDGIFNFKVSDIYNRIYNDDLDMGKHEEQFKKEEELLRKACGENDKDFNLIQELLALQKTKVLLKNKVGLQNELEGRLEQHLLKV